VAEAELARFIDRWTVEYIRTYPHPIERVWRAITEPEQFRAWFIPGSLEPKVGGAYQFGGPDFSGTVVAWAPLRRVRFSNAPNPDEAYFQYELEAAGEGTRMRFVQRFSPNETFAETPDDLGGDLPGGPGTPWKPGFVGGWHEFFDALGDYMGGIPTGAHLPPTEMGAIVEAFARDMVKSGRMEEGQARRLVLGLRRQERWNELNKIYRAHIAATCPPEDHA
jgi:uncharacterized protein YndB with AHSA1/START domain